MVRVVSITTGRGVIQSLILVMAVADAVALTAISIMPKPVFNVMGGIRLTESEAAVLDATLLVYAVGILSAPIWAIGAVTVFFTGKPAWQVPSVPAERVSAGWGLWLLGALRS